VITHETNHVSGGYLSLNPKREFACAIVQKSKHQI